MVLTIELSTLCRKFFWYSVDFCLKGFIQTPSDLVCEATYSEARRVGRDLKRPKALVSSQENFRSDIELVKPSNAL